MDQLQLEETARDIMAIFLDKYLSALDAKERGELYAKVIEALSKRCK